MCVCMKACECVPSRMRLRRSSWPSSRARRAERADARPSHAARAASSLACGRQRTQSDASQVGTRRVCVRCANPRRERGMRACVLCVRGGAACAAHHSRSYAFCSELNSRSATAAGRTRTRTHNTRVSAATRFETQRASRFARVCVRTLSLRRLALVRVQLQRLLAVRLRSAPAHARTHTRASAHIHPHKCPACAVSV